MKLIALLQLLFMPFSICFDLAKGTTKRRRR